MRKKCERSLNILKVLSNTLWGADRVSLLRVYQALILSRLDYGCVVYGSACASVLKRLDTVHHSALRICSLSGDFRTSPVASLYVVGHQPPLKLRRRVRKRKLFRHEGEEPLVPQLVDHFFPLLKIVFTNEKTSCGRQRKRERWMKGLMLGKRTCFFRQSRFTMESDF
ncbi:putative RNA-directed DNA polymerase from transposon X-element [Trichonephila clavipes]|nr:putative RNA-directed DNA polymerase from transposon X-element [Trichonephila clavipes]